MRSRMRMEITEWTVPIDDASGAQIGDWSRTKIWYILDVPEGFSNLCHDLLSYRGILLKTLTHLIIEIS
jgi:hypothetical protein